MQRHFVEAKNRLSMRRMVWFGCVWMCGLSALLALALLIHPVLEWTALGLSLLMMPIALATIVLARSQKWDWAMQVFTWGNWALAVVTAWWAGGLHSNVTMAFPAWLVIAAWVLGLRATLSMLGLSVLVLALFWVEDSMRSGQIVMVSQTMPMVALLYVLGMMGLAVMTTLMARASLSRRVQKGQEVLASLEQSQQELRKFYRAVEQNPESIVITDPQLRVVYVNDAFLVRTGYTRSEVLGQPSEQVSTMGLERNQRQRALVELTAGGIWRGEMTNRTRNGAALRESVLVAPIRSPQGVIVNYVELKQDLSERVLAARRIHDLVYLDVLTGLANRHSLTLKIKERTTATDQDHKQLHGLLLIDIDRFSIFNDVHGMQHSDALLRAFAQRLVEVHPQEALIARIATAEFAVLMKNVASTAQEVEDVLMGYAKALQKSLQRPLSIKNWAETEPVSCSIGGSVLELNVVRSVGNDVLRFASVALHEAKQSGPGNIAMFEPRMAEHAHKRFRIARDLRQGIPAGELRMYLQTQADAHGTCVGAEVLVRWQHPQWGLVSPVEFIPVAEESELIVLLGEWVLREACTLLAQPDFRDRNLRLSVNVSAIQFGNLDFVPSLKEILAETGADPQLLTLEITEGVVMRDLDVALARMYELRELGIEIALDDFGTGYSSMSSLKNLPIQELKIDQSFIGGSHTSEIDAALVEAMVLMAQRLRLRVVAEGVEQAAQAHLLTGWHPGIVLQGLLFGRPIPADQWLTQVLGQGQAQEPRPAPIEYGSSDTHEHRDSVVASFYSPRI